MQDQLFGSLQWGTRENLCLTSAVSRVGPNWSTVSNAVKAMCANDAAGRPEEFLSQQSCAMKYAMLLDEQKFAVDEREKSDNFSVNTNKTSSVFLMRILREEWVVELKNQIYKEQEEYAKIMKEINAVESGQVSEEELLKMWHEAEREEEAKRVMEMKMENQMREREQRKKDVQMKWRPHGLPPITPQLESDTTEVDMDVEEIVGSTGRSSLIGPPVQESSVLPLLQGTSPLLSSLLKCPALGSGAVSASVTLVSNSVSNSVRIAASAPTITTLLTSGTHPNPNQPVVTLKNIHPKEAEELLTRPISGPPGDSLSVSSASTPVLLSPSQSAPTLSMLLEKSKATSSFNAGSMLMNPPKNKTTTQKVTEYPINHSNKETVSMNLDGEIVGSSDATNALTTADSDDTDQNEEQQLLEVFKSIGNIGELDIDVAAVIDEEVDFLKDVNDVMPNESVNFEKIKDPVDILKSTMLPESSARKSTVEVNVENTEKGHQNANEVETISREDSNDTLFLVAAALSDNNQSHTSETENDKGDSEGNLEERGDTIEKTSLEESSINERDDMSVKMVYNDEIQLSEGFKELNEERKSLACSESSDVILIPTDDDEDSTNGIKTVDEPKTENVLQDTHEEYGEQPMKDENTSNDYSSDAVSPSREQDPNQKVVEKAPIPPTSNVDNDDSTIDMSISTPREDRVSSKIQSNQRRSVQDSVRGTDHKPEDEQKYGTVASTNVARSHVLRKLRDRDRSESPIVEEDALNPTCGDPVSVQRIRYRVSTTPVFDSIPSSPSSSDRDEHEIRGSKKHLLSIYYALQPKRNTSLFQRAQLEQLYCLGCTQSMGFHIIKRNIETGAIRNPQELQRDVLLMCQNAEMVFKAGSDDIKAVFAFRQESQSIREFVGHSNLNSSESVSKAPEKEEKEMISSVGVGSSSSKSRTTGSRKSQRFI